MPSHVRLLDDIEPVDRLAFEIALASRLKPGDRVLCVPDDVVPADGIVIEGTATTDAGAVTFRGLRICRGTRLRSGYLVVCIA